MPAGRDNFRYLNVEGKWLNFHWKGLELSAGGELRLASAPALTNQFSRTDENVPTAPRGVARDDAGRVFYSIPEANQVVIAGGCDPQSKPLMCLTETAGFGPLDTPRGLLVLQKSSRLVVADSGNNRLLFCDLENLELREVWGLSNLAAWPLAPDSVSQFRKPWTVATDLDEENLYVLEAGNGRVSKFSRSGESDTDFIENIQNSGLIKQPGALAVSGRGASTRVFVSDLSSDEIFLFDSSGNPLLDGQGAPLIVQHAGMGSVVAVAASETALFVGDNQQQRILCFGLDDDLLFHGEALGFRGCVTAMAFNASDQTLLVLSAEAEPPLSLEAFGAYLNFGFLWSEPISVAAAVNWGRLHAAIEKPEGAHIEFFYAVSDQPERPLLDSTADNPFADSRWQVVPQDVHDFLLEGPQSAYLFLGAAFSSNRQSTPVLKQLRVEFNGESFTQYLPAIYREPPDANSFLRRFVNLLGSEFVDLEEEIDSLVRYFDPLAAPAAALAWLGSWLAVELDEGEGEQRMRQSIARAFRRYQWRGTVAGLRLALLEDAGVHAVISEPISAGTFWAMAQAADCSGGGTDGPQLGSTTLLSAMEPGGAVLGSTAQLDRSYLMTDAQYGEPLFDGAAYQFVVEVYRAEVNTDARLNMIREIIEREKPAHTMYRLLLIDPTMRLGTQARAGVDSIVGGVGGPARLGDDGGSGLRLGGSLPPRIGTIRLGEELKI
jgi:phage tail-like protein